MKKTICLLLALTLCAALAAPALADSTPLIYRITDGEEIDFELREIARLKELATK